MDERILKWLYDIKIAIDEINEYFLEQEKDFLKYRQNLMLKRAIERNLEIIGEAVNRILTRDKEFELKVTNAKSIVGLRNQLIHAYDNISDENVWSILINHLPKLKIEIGNLIKTTPLTQKAPHFCEAFRDPAGIRTQDHYIKSVMLYQLSYGINSF